MPNALTLPELASLLQGRLELPANYPEHSLKQSRVQRLLDVPRLDKATQLDAQGSADSAEGVTDSVADAVIVVAKVAELQALLEPPLLASLAAVVTADPAATLAQLACPVVQVADNRVALAQLSRHFDNAPPVATGISPQAQIHPTARLETGVQVAANAVIEAEAVIGAGCVIGAACYVGQGVHIGANCKLYPHVSLYHNVRLGAGVVLHSGVVIGADGFGYAVSRQGLHKIHHLGSVELGDGVEIGANSCVDRATLGVTRIGAHCKIDNLCQIGHNVHMGEACLIAAHSGIGGSTVLGRGVWIGGGAHLADHLQLGDGARLIGHSGLTKNIPAGETWGGYPAKPYHKWTRELYLLTRLEPLWQAFKGKRT